MMGLVMLPLWFLLALRFLVRRQEGVKAADWAVSLDALEGLRRLLPAGRNAVERALVQEMELWILNEKLRVIRLEQAGVTHSGYLRE